MNRRKIETPCRQVTTVAFELRSMTETRGDAMTELALEGHASVFGVDYDVAGGPGNGYGWYERIERGAFDATLAEDPDVVFLFDHDGMPLARTKSGTLELEADKVGLAVRATLDVGNPQVQALRSGVERGDIDEMSFGFRVTEQTWTAHEDFPDDEMSHRSVSAVNIHRGDVSAVTYGASPSTDIDIIRSLEQLNGEQLVEARAVLDRLTLKRSGGMPGTDAVGMTAADLALLRPPPNPLLTGVNTK